MVDPSLFLKGGSKQTPKRFGKGRPEFFSQEYRTWEESLEELCNSCDTKSSVLWTYDNGYFRYAEDGHTKESVYLHTVNRQALLFFKAMMVRNRSGLLVYPSFDTTVIPLLALEAFYYRIHERRLEGRDRLVIFSSRSEFRTEIIHDFSRLNVGNAQLAYDAFPVGIVHQNGEDSFLRKNPKRGPAYPRLLISPGPVALPNAGIGSKVFCMIIEATADVGEEHAKALFDWAKTCGVPFMFVVSPDPPTFLARLMISKRYPYWGWDAETLAVERLRDEENLKARRFGYLTPFCSSFREIENKSNRSKVFIAVVRTDETPNKMLVDLRQRYLQLLRSAEYHNAPGAVDLAHRYLGCIYAIEESLAPIAYSEAESSKPGKAIPIRRRLEIIRQLCERDRSIPQMIASYASSCADRLQATIDFMEEHKVGKHELVIEAIEEARENGAIVLFATRTEYAKRALLTFLQRTSKLDQGDGILIDTVTNILAGRLRDRKIDTCILYGVPRYYERDILSYPDVRNMGIFVYESELGAAKYTIEKLDELNSLFSDSVKIRNESLVFGRRIEKRKYEKAEKPDKVRTKIIVVNARDTKFDENIPPEVLLSAFLSKDLLVEDELSTETEIDFIAKKTNRDYHSDFVPAVLVSLRGDRHVSIFVEKYVQVYDVARETVRNCFARDLKRGDLLVLIDNTTRRSLADSLIAKVENHPSMTRHVAWQRLWYLLLRQSIEETNDTFSDVVKKLADEGAKSPKDPSAIYSWYTGATLGPRDLRNIQRIGKIYHQPALIDHYSEIVTAIRKTRVIHIILAKRLARLIPHAATATDGRGKSESTVIDEKLDLYLEDFANTVTIEPIEKVEVVESVPVRMLDKVMAGRNHD